MHPIDFIPSSALFRLMDLPNELIKLVCSHADLSVYDLMALRRTCKLTREFSSDEFARRCFHSITVLIARSSLLAFIELSQHPRFGPFIQCINISPTIASEEGLKVLPPATAPHRHGVPVPLAFQRVEDFILDVQCMDTMRTYLNRLREENELKTDGSAEQMLNIAFKAFAERKQDIRLSFSDQETNAVGAKHLLPNRDFGERTVWHLEWKETIARTIKAAFKQGCTIVEIALHETGRKDAQNNSSCCTDDIEQELASVRAQLTCLTVDFEHRDIETTSRSIERMVSAVKDLSWLYLHQIGEFDDSNQRYMPEILDCVAATSLEQMSLGYCRMSQSQLTAFIEKHSATLHDLQLHEACLITGSCMSLIAWIKDNLPCLKYLELDGMCEHGNKTTCDGDAFKSYWVGYGKEKDVQVSPANMLDGKYDHETVVEEYNELVGMNTKDE
ncbi:hypothetical protein D6C84_02388 [Aureobasidium pullulans]|uniref:F-box domain-containing protein n=1 Tax=Aureobasidium pullulans TaxID=5580 RepID=A0A4V4L248_AURPU|nr:hypothetical protein D6C84_02388 [Aureobasidium pullulans]